MAKKKKSFPKAIEAQVGGIATEAPATEGPQPPAKIPALEETEQEAVDDGADVPAETPKHAETPADGVDAQEPLSVLDVSAEDVEIPLDETSEIANGPKTPKTTSEPLNAESGPLTPELTETAQDSPGSLELEHDSAPPRPKRRRSTKKTTPPPNPLSSLLEEPDVHQDEDFFVPIKFPRFTFPLREDLRAALSRRLAEIQIEHEAEISIALVLRLGLERTLQQLNEDPDQVLIDLFKLEQKEIAMSGDKKYPRNRNLRDTAMRVSLREKKS